MKKSLLEIYSLAVCFVAVICATVTLGVGFYDILEFSNPEMTLRSYQYQMHQTNEAFTRDWPEDKKHFGEEEITQMRETSYAVAIAAERRDAVQSLVMVLIILILDAIVFVVHWKMSRRAGSAGAA